MCVNRSARTSASRMPVRSSARRSAGSVLDGPGSTSATPAGLSRTAVAITPGTSRNRRSRYEIPAVSVCTSGLSPISGHPDRHEPGDEGETNEARAAHPSLETLPTVAERVAGGCNGRAPDDRAGRVVDEKHRPAHAARAREQGAKHAQPRDEARDEDGLRSVAGEESLELGEPLAREADSPAVPLRERASPTAPDEEPEIVAERRAGNG